MPHIIASLLSIVAVIILSSCAEQRVSMSRAIISEEDSKLVFYDIDAAKMKSRFYKQKTADHSGVSYLGVWTHTHGKFPQARIDYIEPSPNYHFRLEIPPSERLKKLYLGEDAPITAKEKGKTENVLGSVKYQRFVAGMAECFYFSQMWETGSIGETTAGNRLLIGHYCEYPNRILSETRVNEIIKSIGVKGEGVPKPTEEWMAIHSKGMPSGRTESPIVFNWSLFGENIPGTLLRTGGSGSEGRLWFSPTEGVECTGTWRFLSGKYETPNPPQGEWSVLCTNGMSASGTYVSTEPEKATGTGKDREGNSITFTSGG